MKVAVWNFPPAELLTTGMTSGEQSDPFSVQQLLIGDCERVLFEGHVDVALLPTLTILKHHEDLDVVPAVAFSAWRYPFARLAIAHDLSERVRRVAYDPAYEQERFVAEVILREHYRMEPDFVARESPTGDASDVPETDAELYVGPEVPTQALGGHVLDLGQEWYELANYPLTWGLFAAQKGTVSAGSIRDIRDAVRDSERRRKVWMQAHETSREMHDFYADSMRFRLDDLCLAGLTEFRQFLFYYNVVDDVREIPFVFIPDEEEQDQGRKPLL